MITVTLNQIKKDFEVRQDWPAIVEKYNHLGMDAPIPVSNILDTFGIHNAVDCFNAIKDKSVLEHFALWCAMQVRTLARKNNMDDFPLDVLNTLENYLSGKATIEELKAMDGKIEAVCESFSYSEYGSEQHCALSAIWYAYGVATGSFHLACEAADYAASADIAKACEAAAEFRLAANRMACHSQPGSISGRIAAENDAAAEKIAKAFTDAALNDAKQTQINHFRDMLNAASV